LTWKARSTVAVPEKLAIRRRFAIASAVRLLIVMVIIGGGVLAVPLSTVEAQQPRVFTGQVSGIFSQLTSDYTIRVLARAERQQADALLLTINSPGGLDRPVRELNHAILSSEIPVIAYVGPEPESQALSGAFLIALAAHKTIMHPEATIGSAPPPGMTDRIGPEEREARIAFAIDMATRTATVRGRDEEQIAQVERIIEEQLILTAEEAVEAGIVDGIAEERSEALSLVTGETVQTTLGPVELNTDNARLVQISMTWWEIMLRSVTQPNIAYVLLSAGLLLIIVELFTPGRLIAGIPAVVCLALAFVALGNLPVAWFGLALLLLATILFIAELRTPWIGVMGAFGLVAYVAGSLSLYRPWGAMSAFAPDVSDNMWVIVGTMAAWVLVLLITLRAVFRARQSALETALPDLSGHVGVVIEPLTPRGVVRVEEQEWAAVSDVGEVEPSTEVVVDRMASGILYVTPVAESERSVTDERSGTEGSLSRPVEPGS
jgi:membrane-bound serine protease (ClpP class)